MVLKIRLARFGKRHAPIYNIVLAHARTARNSKPLEVLGTYDPIPKAVESGSEQNARKFKDVKLDIDRAKYWLGVGAHPSEPVWRLLSMDCWSPDTEMDSPGAAHNLQRGMGHDGKRRIKQSDGVTDIGLIS